jgi:hypothetical protein
MLFSVIYSADCPRSESIVRFRPPQLFLDTRQPA